MLWGAGHGKRGYEVKGVVCEELFYDMRGLWCMKELKVI